KNKHRGYAMCFGRHQKPANKARRWWWRGQSDDQTGLIQVGPDDLGLLGEIDGFADNIIPTSLQLPDDGTFLIRLHIKMNPITYCNRVCCFNSFGPEFTFDTAIVFPAVLPQYLIPAACGFRYQSSHRSCCITCVIPLKSEKFIKLTV